jgi:hypothetical protein
MRPHPFRVPVAKKVALGPEHNPWYWNPNRVGAGEAPTWFKAKLREVDPEGDIDVRWNPVKQRWGVFYRKPSMRHPLCSGWVLLFLAQYEDGSYLPLDERILARLYEASAAKWGNGKKYFQQVVDQIEHEKTSREKQHTQDTIDIAMESFEHSQIKNINSGSNFSKYHA